MKKIVITSALYTLFTAVLLGVVYPLAVTGIARVVFPAQASGQLIYKNGTLVGAHDIGQSFTSPAYFHSRPSAAGSGYDASASSGSNLGPTSKALVDRVAQSTTQTASTTPPPVDLVTASASGLDPDISPAAALYQVQRIAHERGLSTQSITQLIDAHIQQRQFGLLGEPRVNVLELNLALDVLYTPHA